MRRARRRGLNDRQVAALRRRSKRYVVADPELSGMYVRVPPAGPCIFVAVARDPFHRQTWATIGASDVLKIEEARELSRVAIRRIRAGLPAVEPPPPQPASFQAVAGNWILRHVEKKGLRSRGEIERCLRVYIYPFWKDREFETIRRSDVTKLLDHVEDNHGPRQADAVLSIVRAIANFHASRSDDFVSPIARGMRRSDPETRARKRTLTDAELKIIWAATATGVFGGLVRILLLTGQRLSKVQTMRWDDIDPDGIWSIPTQIREKGNAGALKLPKVALDVIASQRRHVGNPHVFVGRSRGMVFNSATSHKIKFDAQTEIRGWILHDLRRTARSLMSRAGVRPEIAERVLGHAIKGIEKIYDRHAYFNEKAEALEQLAAVITSIVDPPADNVVPLYGRGEQACA
jgi:integrase